MLRLHGALGSGNSPPDTPFQLLITTQIDSPKDHARKKQYSFQWRGLACVRDDQSFLKRVSRGCSEMLRHS